jgi:hypothetical protein
MTTQEAPNLISPKAFCTVAFLSCCTTWVYYTFSVKVPGGTINESALSMFGGALLGTMLYVGAGGYLCLTLTHWLLRKCGVLSDRTVSAHADVLMLVIAFAIATLGGHHMADSMFTGFKIHALKEAKGAPIEPGPETGNTE